MMMATSSVFFLFFFLLVSSTYADLNSTAVKAYCVQSCCDFNNVSLWENGVVPQPTANQSITITYQDYPKNNNTVCIQLKGGNNLSFLDFSVLSYYDPLVLEVDAKGSNVTINGDVVVVGGTLRVMNSPFFVAERQVTLGGVLGVGQLSGTFELVNTSFSQVNVENMTYIDFSSSVIVANSSSFTSMNVYSKAQLSVDASSNFSVMSGYFTYYSTNTFYNTPSLGSSTFDNSYSSTFANGLKADNLIISQDNLLAAPTFFVTGGNVDVATVGGYKSLIALYNTTAVIGSVQLIRGYLPGASFLLQTGSNLWIQYEGEFLSLTCQGEDVAATIVNTTIQTLDCTNATAQVYVDTLFAWGTFGVNGSLTVNNSLTVQYVNVSGSLTLAPNSALNVSYGLTVNDLVIPETASVNTRQTDWRQIEIYANTVTVRGSLNAGVVDFYTTSLLNLGYAQFAQGSEISGNYQQATSATLLLFNLEGGDRTGLIVNGSVALNGTLQYGFIWNQWSGSSQQLITGNNVMGTFEGQPVKVGSATTPSPSLASLSYSSTSVVLRFNEPKKPMLQWWVWLLIGLGGAGVVVGVVTAIIITRRRRGGYSSV